MSTHLRLPLQVGPDGEFNTVEEDSDAEILQNVQVVLASRPGERLATIELGTDDPTFVGADPAALFAQVERWEPRVDLDLLGQAVDVLRDDPGFAERTEVLVLRQEG